MAVQRWAAEAGSTVRLRVRFEHEGTLFDPLLIDQVEILDPGDTVIATLTTGITKQSTGIWYVDYAMDVAAVSGVYHDRWTWRPFDGFDLRTASLPFNVFPAGTFAAVNGYLTADEVKASYLVGTTLTDDEIDFLVRLCTAFAENACGRKFIPESDTVDVDGSGRAFLHVPGTRSLRTLTSLTDLDTGSALDTTNLRIRGRTLFHKDFRWPNIYQASPIFSCGDGGEVFPRGIKNVRITGTWGDFDSPPELIKHVVGIMVKMAGSDDTVTAPWISNYLSESVDGLSVTYRDMDPGTRMRAMTGIPEIDAILNQYRQRKGRIAPIGG